MNKPEVRIIQPQQEEIRQADVSQSEADYLLSKYGYKTTNISDEQPTFNPNQDLTFEQMMELQQKKEQSERTQRQMNIQNQLNAPKPITFDNVGYSETKWSDIEIDSDNKFGIKIQIVTDMKIR